jgi:hypothetical protein
MSKHRFTNTDKWNDKWFHGLTPHAKLLFMFLTENCDNAGIYEIDMNFLVFLTGLTEDQLKDAIDQIRGSYVISKDKTRLWLKNFLKHQKKLPLNDKNNNHKQILMILRENVRNESKFMGCSEMIALIPNESAYAIDKENVPKIPRHQFIKPTLTEVSNYMKSLKFDDYEREADRFMHHFESNGWKVGRNPMKSWVGAVNTWIMNWYDRRGQKPHRSKISIIQEAHEDLSSVDWNSVYKDEQVTMDFAN